MAIDPGDVVVDGVDDVSAEDHNKQRTALLALETGTTAQTTVGTITTGTWTGTTVAVANGGTGGTSQATAQSALNVPPVADVNSSGAVIKVQGNAVDSGTPNFGQAYVWDGDSFNPTSVTQQVLSDAGAAGIIGTNSASAITILAGTKPDIAANTLAVGDLFRYEFGGNFETVGGAASTMTFQLFWDANNIGNMVTASIAITTLASWVFTVTVRVTAIGASGSVAWNVIGASNVAAGSTVVASSSTTSSIDTTQALTQDCKVTTSSNNANNTFSCTLATGTYTPKFA